MKQYHFKPKKYGYGVYPTTIYGWIYILGFVFLVVLSSYSNGFFDTNIGPSDHQVARFVIDVFLISISSLYIFTPMTDGDIRRRWGE